MWCTSDHNVRICGTGIDARLTRTGDTFIPLYDRVEIAHQHGADLFMSIHADGFTNLRRCFGVRLLNRRGE